MSVPVELFGMTMSHVRRERDCVRYSFFGKGVSATIDDRDDGKVVFSIVWPDAVSTTVAWTHDYAILLMRRQLIETGHRVFGGAA